MAELTEGTGAIVRRSPGKSAAVKKAQIVAEPAVAPTPKAPKKKAAAAKADDLGELDAPVAATPKGKKAAVAATPKPKKAAVVADDLEASDPPKAAPIVPSPKQKKAAVAATGLTTVAPVKGGLTAPAAENNSLKMDIDKIPKLLECTNSERVFCNVPPGLLTAEQEANWKAGLKAAQIATLTYKKLTTLHEQMANRSNQDLMISGWVADPEDVQPIFGKGVAFTYVFIYPTNIKDYALKLEADNIDHDKAVATARGVRESYNKHLEKFEHAVITALVKIPL
jgi:hypothetical protein